MKRKKKGNSDTKVCIIEIIFIVAMLLLIPVGRLIVKHNYAAPADNWTKYYNDVKWMHYNLTVQVDNGYSIKGENFLKNYEENLYLKDKNENVLATSIDDFNIVRQNTHTVEYGDVTYVMDGKVAIFKDHYNISIDGVKTLSADIGVFGGKFVDENDKVVATIQFNVFGKDYSLYISPDCPIPDDVMILFVASYRSDLDAEYN